MFFNLQFCASPRLSGKSKRARKNYARRSRVSCFGARINLSSSSSTACAPQETHSMQQLVIWRMLYLAHSWPACALIITEHSSIDIMCRMLASARAKIKKPRSREAVCNGINCSSNVRQAGSQHRRLTIIYYWWECACLKFVDLDVVCLWLLNYPFIPPATNIDHLPSSSSSRSQKRWNPVLLFFSFYFFFHSPLALHFLCTLCGLVFVLLRRG